MAWCAIAAGVFLAYTVYRHRMANQLGNTWGSRLIAYTHPLLNLLDISCHRSAKPVRAAGTNPQEAGLLLLIFVFSVFVAVLLSARPTWSPNICRFFSLSA
jgi:hypothetical protein